MRHPEFPVVSFLVVPLMLASLPSHIRARNVSTISLVVWLSVMNVIRGVNSLVWAGNVDVKLIVWCDITTKITVGFTYAVPAAALCILRHLETISSTRFVSFSKKTKRNRHIFEAVMCWLLPLVFMGLHYVIQGHRFDITEDLGCSPSVYVSVPAVFILWVPPLLLSTMSAIYAVFSLKNFLRNRISFATHLQNSQSAISPSRYFRLMALAIIEIAWDTGINVYLLSINVTQGLRPWTTWRDVHSDFSRIDRYPNFLVPITVINEFVFEWWIVPISATFFIVFFGFCREALSDYKRVLVWIRCKVFQRQPSEPQLPVMSSHLPDVPKTPHDVKIWESPFKTTDRYSSYSLYAFEPKEALYFSSNNTGHRPSSLPPLSDLSKSLNVDPFPKRLSTSLSSI